MTAHQVDFEQRIGQYIALRNKTKEISDRHKQELAPYRDAMEKLEALLLGALNASGQDSAKATSGTVYKTVKRTASLDDPEAFLVFVQASGRWELLDRKANVTAVADYMEQEQLPVPGVKFSSRIEVGVRSPAIKK